MPTPDEAAKKKKRELQVFAGLLIFAAFMYIWGLGETKRKEREQNNPEPIPVFTPGETPSPSTILHSEGKRIIRYAQPPESFTGSPIGYRR